MERALPVVVAALALLLGCTKSEPTPAPSPEEGDKAGAASAAVEPAPVVAAPAESARTAGKEAEGGGKTATSASAAPDASRPGALECGTKPLPDCPLQAWMKTTANPPALSRDVAGLAAALDQLATFAPPEYPNWASISKDGAKAARSGDVDAAKASCRSCHEQYKAKYKAEMRARKI